jgi:hypothetical protein
MDGDMWFAGRVRRRGLKAGPAVEVMVHAIACANEIGNGNAAIEGNVRTVSIKYVARPPGKLIAALQKAGVEFIAGNVGGRVLKNRSKR